MKKMKRWMAFLLVTVMIAGAGIRQLNTTMSANETDVSEQSAQEAEGQADAKAQAEAEAKAQAEAEAKAQAEAEANAQAEVEAAAQADAEVEAQTEEVQTSETEAQTEPQTSKAAVVEKEAEVTYDVSIKEPQENGGAVKVWTTGEKRDVSFSGGLYKEVLKEGETLHIEITANGDYEVEKVTDENGASIRQTSVNEKVYNYEIANVTSNKTVNIIYKKTETAEEKKEETGEKKDDGKKADSAEESDEGEADSKEEVKEPKEAPSEEMKNEAEAEKPAQTLTTTAKGGVQIKVTAPEGALPEGATVKAVKADSAAVKNAVEEAVSEEGKELVSYAAYDITIMDKDGNEIQPDENVRVSISGTLIGGAEKEVYHVADGNADKVAGAMAIGNVAVFTAEHFSVYAVTGSGSSELAQVNKLNSQSLPEEEAAVSRIYIYVKIDGDVNTSDWIQNGDSGNWYTIGYIDVPTTVCPPASEFERGYYYSEGLSEVADYIKDHPEEIQFYNEFVAGAFDLGNVNWNADGFGLKAEKGASNSYPDVQDLTWHLDGLLTIEEETYTLAVDYADESKTLELPDNISREGLETNTSYEFPVPSYSGYTYTVTDKNNQDVTASVQGGKIKGTITVSDASYTVRYYRNDTKTRIYIYVQLIGDVDPSIWIPNGDPGNWYTIGYIDVPVTVCPPASGHKQGDYYPDECREVVSYIGGHLNEINFFNEFVAEAFDFDSVNWNADGFGLKAEKGASNNYPDVHGLTWHLDGLLTTEGESNEQQNPGLSIEKTAEQKADGYTVGDEIVYTINVVNSGNVTIKDINVADELTEDTWTIDSLEPSETKTFTTKPYTVKEEDLFAGKVVNVATVSGTDSDGDKVEDTDDATVTTETVSRSLDVTKTVTNTPANGSAYQTGESINYEVVVTNTGNVTLYNINVTDQMQGAAGNAELRAGESATIAELAPGASAEPLHYTYTVRAADAGATLTNTATATAPGDDNDGDPTEGSDTTPGEPVVPTPTVTPGGNPTVTPGGNPAGPATPAALIPAAAPVVDTIEGFVRELTSAEDDEVPLANNNLEHEHKCCIFHSLVLLISLILLAFFTRSMKKRQEKIFELREELDTELAKRGLPLSNENK